MSETAPHACCHQAAGQLRFNPRYWLREAETEPRWYVVGAVGGGRAGVSRVFVDHCPWCGVVLDAAAAPHETLLATLSECHKLHNRVAEAEGLLERWLDPADMDEATERDTRAFLARKGTK